MRGSSSHIRDNHLFDCYFAERAGDWVDPRTAEHLADCASCAGRYGEIAGFLDGVRSEADAETAALFPPDRLRAAQQQIAQRIEHIGQPAHVLSFPSRVGRHMTVASRVAPRWIAAAAAAGLFVGVGAGSFLNTNRMARQDRSGFATGISAAPVPASPSAVQAPTTDAAPQPGTERTAPADDEVDSFLADLEAALDRPRTHELLPFDEFTPRVRGISNQIR